MLSDEAREILTWLPDVFGGPLRPIQQERDEWEGSTRGQTLPAGVRLDSGTVAGVAGEWLLPELEAELIAELPVLVFVHGGGFYSGSPRTHRSFAARLCVELGKAGHDVAGFLPEYRLAPEHPFPAGLDDCIAATGALLASGRPVILAGDSAGGCLAVGAALALGGVTSEAGHPPSGLVLVSPQLDLTCSGESFTANVGYANFSPEDIERCTAMYLDGTGLDRADPRVSPLFADLRGLPQTLVVAGGHDVFRDDAIRFHERATDAGIGSELMVGAGLWHSYPFFDCPEADAAVELIVRFVGGLLATR